MVSKYLLFPRAQEDLENIFKYISVDLLNHEAALNLTNKFESKFDELF